MKRPAVLLFLILLPSVPARGVIVDRIAALVERQVITLSEVGQLADLRVIPRNPGETDDAYRRRLLDGLIAQSLRLSDAERFGAEDVAKDSIEARLLQVRGRFPSEAQFLDALGHTELTLDELRAILKRQLQVEAYIEERFSPLIFVSIEEIEIYYRGPWLEQRRARGLASVPLSEVREEIRSLLKAERLEKEVSVWTEQLRARANVDVYVYR